MFLCKQRCGVNNTSGFAEPGPVSGPLTLSFFFLLPYSVGRWWEVFMTGNRMGHSVCIPIALYIPTGSPLIRIWQVLFASMFIFRSCVCRKSLSVLIRRTGSCCVLSTRPQAGPSKHRRLPKITPRNNPLKWLLTAAGCGGGFHPAAAQTAERPAGRSHTVLGSLGTDWVSGLRWEPASVNSSCPDWSLSGAQRGDTWISALSCLSLRGPPHPPPQGSGQKVSLSGVSTKALGYHQ